MKRGEKHMMINVFERMMWHHGKQDDVCHALELAEALDPLNRTFPKSFINKIALYQGPTGQGCRRKKLQTEVIRGIHSPPRFTGTLVPSVRSVAPPKGLGQPTPRGHESVVAGHVLRQIELKVIQRSTEV